MSWVGPKKNMASLFIVAFILDTSAVTDSPKFPASFLPAMSWFEPQQDPTLNLLIHRTGPFSGCSDYRQGVCLRRVVGGKCLASQLGIEFRNFLIFCTTSRKIMTAFPHASQIIIRNHPTPLSFGDINHDV
jgi:hypothetical protein